MPRLFATKTRTDTRVQLAATLLLGSFVGVCAGVPLGFLAAAVGISVAGPGNFRVEFTGAYGAGYGVLHNLTDRWQKVQFTGAASTQSPVVVVGPLSTNDPGPAHVRVRNVTAGGFEVRVESPTGSHKAEKAFFIVIPEATYHDSASGIGLEAHTLPGVTSAGQTVAFPQAFDQPPVVLAQVTSETNRNRPALAQVTEVTPTGFSVRAVGQSAEQVSYIALSPTAEPIFGQYKLEVGRLSGVGSDWKNLAFSQTLGQEPVLLAASQSASPTDAVPAAVRYRNLNGQTVALALDSQSANSRRLSGVQDTGYLAIERLIPPSAHIQFGYPRVTGRAVRGAKGFVLTNFTVFTLHSGEDVRITSATLNVRLNPRNGSAAQLSRLGVYDGATLVANLTPASTLAGAPDAESTVSLQLSQPIVVPKGVVKVFSVKADLDQTVGPGAEYAARVVGGTATAVGAVSGRPALVTYQARGRGVKALR